MARFNMNTLVKLADRAVADAMLAKSKNPQYHHDLLLKKVIAAGDAGISCSDLCKSLEAEKATAMTAAGVATWDKYSDSCHAQYFINRCRGAVIAVDAEGKQLPQGPTKAKKAAKPAEAAPVAAEAAPAEAAVAVEAPVDAALAELGIQV